MRLRIDPDSPIPLYHQIAEALRTVIEAGDLAPGEALEPMRQAAETWGVNVHTVRHAYAALARDGLVERKRGPRGTRVLRSGQPSRPSSRAETADLDTFLARIHREAGELFGLTPVDLAAALAQATARSPAQLQTVHIVECSTWQCRSHAAEIESIYNVRALPWTLDQRQQPPDGPAISTYFHYNDVRRQWPGHLARMNFLTIYPDPELRRRLAGHRRVLVCERDSATAETVAADLATLLNAKTKIEPRIVDQENPAPLRGRSDAPVLFAPRVWAELPEKLRSHPRAVELRYVLDPGELDAMAKQLGWQPKAGDVAAKG